MIELTVLATTILVLGLLFIPRTTFLITWFFNTAAVATVLGGSALVLAILGFFFVPRLMFTYFLLEAVSGAPASGSALYWTYMGIAAMLELSTLIGGATRTRTHR